MFSGRLRPHHWRKSSQFFVLTRRHAEARKLPVAGAGGRPLGAGCLHAPFPRAPTGLSPLQLMMLDTEVESAFRRYCYVGVDPLHCRRGAVPAAAVQPSWLMLLHQGCAGRPAFSAGGPQGHLLPARGALPADPAGPPRGAAQLRVRRPPARRRQRHAGGLARPRRAAPLGVPAQRRSVWGCCTSCGEPTRAKVRWAPAGLWAAG